MAYRRALCVSTDISIDVQLKDGRTKTFEIIAGGDLSNAHSRCALQNPVYRSKLCSGVCCVCDLDKDDWDDEEACAEAVRRNLVLQHTSNHVDWRRLVPGAENLPASVCPYCLEPVDADLEEKEAAEMAGLSKKGLKDWMRKFIADHHGAAHGEQMTFKHDHRNIARSALHTKTNCTLYDNHRSLFSFRTKRRMHR